MFKSKASISFATIGGAIGIFVAFKKNKPIQEIAITGGVFAAIGLLIGGGITKLYE